MTVATNHAAAASAVLRADAPAPPIPITGLAVEIAARAVAGRHRFEIRLDPPELGRIDVRLDIDRHGAVTSRLLVDRPETLDLLRRDAAQIERALQDAGLKTAENSLQFMLRDQAFDREQQAQAETDAARIVLADADLNAVDTAPQSHGRWPGLGGGIDIRV
jgi:chemotaxis protein MotD